MSKNAIRVTFIFISVALAAVSLIFQFLPCWTYDGIDISINYFVWFPTHDECEGLLEQIAATVGKPELQMLDFVWPIVFQTVFCITTIVMCLWRSVNLAIALHPVVCGAAGTLAFLTADPLKLGNNWLIQLIISIAILICGLIALFYGIQIWRERKNVRKPVV